MLFSAEKFPRLSMSRTSVACTLNLPTLLKLVRPTAFFIAYPDSLGRIGSARRRSM